MKRIFTLLTAALLLVSLSARADEGMWLVQCLDKALEKNMRARGLKLSAREIYDDQAGSLSDAIVSLGFYCSGSLISDDGLLITNHHCVYHRVAEMSTPEHNYLEDGFWANSRADEMPLDGEEFYILRKVLDVSDEVQALKDSLQLDQKPFGGRRLAAILEKKYGDLYGMEAGLTGMWAGSQHYICLYDKYTDIRLVASPPVQVAAFGGDEDNWEWPQHKGDFALYRIYRNGEPLHPVKHLAISRKGYKEGDFAMVMGYPGTTQRYASAAEIQQKILVECPVEIRLRSQQMEIIRGWMDADPAIRMKYTNHFFSLSNVAELQEGEAACVKRFDVIAHRKAFEEELRAAGADNAALLDKLDASYVAISALEKDKVYFRETLIRSVRAARILIRMNGCKKNLEQERAALAQGLPQLDARVEKDLLKLSVREFMTGMDPVFFKPIHKELLERFGTDYDAMAGWLWNNSCLAAMGEIPDDELVARYQGGVQDDPLLRFVHELSVAEINRASHGLADKVGPLRRNYTRACYQYLKAKGVPQYPDANSTLRLTYGRVQPLRPWDGIYVHWQSTARGLREKYNPDQYDFHYPDAFKEVLPPVDFPVNFLTDNDITGGNSGSPVLNARGEIIGLAFDGNKESLAGNYESIPGYNMCVCVDIRYVMWIIQHLGKQQYILDELAWK